MIDWVWQSLYTFDSDNIVNDWCTMSSGEQAALTGRLHRWHKPTEQKLLPAEHVLGAIRTGLRYMRHSTHVRALCS
jgi:hypothetical protein